MPVETRAAILAAAPARRPYAVSAPLAIETVLLDDPGPGEALVRIHAAGLCHSDLSVINGDRPRPLPMALGHEASGVVERVGEGVATVAPGDHVVMVFVPSCGCCAPCAEGRPALCEPGAAANGAGTLLGGGQRIRWKGAPVHHHVGVSGFAGHAVLSARSLVAIPREIDLDIAALFGCAVLTGAGAVINTSRLKAGQSVAVIGLGGVGLSAVMAARAAGASDIIAIDSNPAKLPLARAVGATAALEAGADTLATVRDLTNGGVHVAVETAGVGPAFDLAYAVTRRGGQTVTASLANPALKVAIQQVNLVAEERTVRGSYLGGGVPSRDVLRLMRLWQAGRLPVETLLTSRGSLDDINPAFDALAEGRTVRHLLQLGGTA